MSPTCRRCVDDGRAAGSSRCRTGVGRCGLGRWQPGHRRQPGRQGAQHVEGAHAAPEVADAAQAPADPAQPQHGHRTASPRAARPSGRCCPALADHDGIAEHLAGYLGDGDHHTRHHVPDTRSSHQTGCGEGRFEAFGVEASASDRAALRAGITGRGRTGRAAPARPPRTRNRTPSRTAATTPLPPPWQRSTTLAARPAATRIACSTPPMICHRTSASSTQVDGQPSSTGMPARALYEATGSRARLRHLRRDRSQRCGVWRPARPRSSRRRGRATGSARVGMPTWRSSTVGDVYLLHRGEAAGAGRRRGVRARCR